MSVTAQEAARKQLLRFESRAANPKLVHGIPWGIEKLDYITSGIQRKEVLGGEKVGDNELIALIADTGTGKSSFAGWIAQNIAQYFKDHEPDKEVRLVTLEMSGEKFGDRMAAAKSGVPLHRIKTGMFLTPAQMVQYGDAVMELAELPIRYIGAEDTPTLAHLGNSISKTGEGEKRCGFFIIDHLQICPGANSAENSVGALNDVVEGLVKLSVNVSPGLVLAQMSKAALSRVNKRPQKGDIRNNSSLSNAATTILGLYREDVYTSLSIAERPKVLPAELEILKSRDGEMGVIELELIADRMRWEVKAK